MYKPTKSKAIDYIKLNKKANEYFYTGYDIFFMHGWMCSYLSAPSDSEEDEIIPCYLILNEENIKKEEEFTAFIDDLMLIFTELAENIYEKNKLIKPLINLSTPNNFNTDNLSDEEQKNLLIWLYGYLNGYLSIGSDITEYCNDEKLLDVTFFPALQEICGTLLKLEDKNSPSNIFSGTVLDNYNDVHKDIIEMWEEDENGRTIVEEFHDKSLQTLLNGLVNALNAIFYTVRIADEARLNSQSVSPLLKNLVVH